MEYYRSKSSRKRQLARFMIGLYKRYGLLRKEDRRTREIARVLKAQLERDESSRFKKMLYTKAEKKRKSAEWNYYIMNETPASTKLKIKEKYTCQLFDKVCQKANKRFLLAVLTKRLSPLYDVVGELIYWNLYYATGRIYLLGSDKNFDSRLETRIANRRSRFLLRQFPAVRKDFFCSRFSDIFFNAYIQQLKRGKYHFK